MPAKTKSLRNTVVLEGSRTPFLRSGTAYNDLLTYDLGRMAVSGLLHRTRIDPDLVDLVIFGTVVQEPATSNLAREVVVGTALPNSCPAYTITMACVTSLQTTVDAVRAIASGQANVVIAGGAELLSDVPIRFRRPFRKKLIASSRAKGLFGYLKLLKGFRLAHLLPEAPAIAEYSTGETMGQNAERLAKRYGISREEQDAFALQTHKRAARATEEGLLARQIVPARLPPKFKAITVDNGIRGDTTLEKLANLRPAFDRKFGTVTAGNSSFLTDGASAVLLAGEEAARKMDREPLAVIRSVMVTAMDPLEELLLGPAFTIPKLLEAAGLKIDQIGVLEFHEAFASQLLANLKLLEKSVGPIDPQRLNAWGGSLSVGHPFGATGGRLITTCAHRMREEKERYGLVAACAAGALGIAILLERP